MERLSAYRSETGPSNRPLKFFGLIAAALVTIGAIAFVFVVGSYLTRPAFRFIAVATAGARPCADWMLPMWK